MCVKAGQVFLPGAWGAVVASLDDREVVAPGSWSRDSLLAMELPSPPFFAL